MPSGLARKARHLMETQVKVKLRFHVVVFSATGCPKSVERAVFVFARGEHEFESEPSVSQDCSFFWNERVSQVVTLFKDKHDEFEEKTYTLSLYESAQRSKGGEKRKELFAVGKLDLRLYVGAKHGKRVVITLDPKGAAKQAMTCVVTVAAEDCSEAGAAVELQHSPRSVDGSDSDHVEHKSSAVFDEDEPDTPEEPEAVAPRPVPKPLPALPAPVQLTAKAVTWSWAHVESLFAQCCPCLTKPSE